MAEAGEDDMRGPAQASHVHVVLWSCVGGRLMETDFYRTPKGGLYVAGGGGFGFLTMKAAKRAGLHATRAAAASEYRDALKKRLKDLQRKAEQADRLVDQAMDLDAETRVETAHQERVRALGKRGR